MLSRVADAIYWMSRYIERAENVARLIDTNLHMALDMPDGMPEQWEPLVRTTGDIQFYRDRYNDISRSAVLTFLTFDMDNPNSILSCLQKARENARSVREIISSEMWEQINTFYQTVRAASGDHKLEETPHEFFALVKTQSYLHVGLTVATLLHGETWNFCRLGRLIERADKTTRFLDMKYFYLLPSATYVGSPLDSLQWATILRSVSAYEAYRKEYGDLAPERVIEFLLLSRHLPRALHYCLIRAEDALHEISGAPAGTFANAAERYCGQLRAELAFTTATDIITTGLHEFLDGFQIKLNQFGDAVFETFFALRREPVRAGVLTGGRGDA